MLKPGQKLFEYEIVRLLGQGGFANVFEALDKRLNRRVAIKFLQLEKWKEKALKRFLQEARIAASIEHPNVVTIHGLRIEEKKFYMIMEYLPGGSLHHLLIRQGKLPVKQAVDLTLGICEGLAQLHEKKAVHRDIKAENILLTANGRPKVIDFGLAYLPKAMGGIGLTNPGFQPGTVLYNSPEQFRGEDLDPRSDIYQVGELLYFMLTGHHYIDLDELDRRVMSEDRLNLNQDLRRYILLEKAICEEKPGRLPELWREVGPLAGLVEKAMAKDREERFTDIKEFVAALKAFSSNATQISTTQKDVTLNDSRAYNKRGLTHAGMRNYEQAIFDYTRAIKLDRHFVEAYNNRSAAHLMMDNYAQAVLDCDRAIKLAPHFVAAYVNRGIAYTGLRDYRRGVENYDRVIKLNPKNIYAHYNRGNTMVWMGKYKEALAAFGRTIELAPEFVAAYVNRGLTHAMMQNHVPAITDYDRAIELNPEYVYAYFNRAHAHRVEGNTEQSIADYSKVIELNPEHPTVYENRAKAYTAHGDLDKAAYDHARVILQLSAINPKEQTVARSMLMPSIPLDFILPADK